MQTALALSALIAVTLFARDELHRSNAGSWQSAPAFSFLH